MFSHANQDVKKSFSIQLWLKLFPYNILSFNELIYKNRKGDSKLFWSTKNFSRRLHRIDACQTLNPFLRPQFKILYFLLLQVSANNLNKHLDSKSFVMSISIYLLLSFLWIYIENTLSISVHFWNFCFSKENYNE